MAFCNFTKLLWPKKQETDATKVAMRKARDDVSAAQTDLDARFSHLENLVADTLKELKSMREPDQDKT